MTIPDAIAGVTAGLGKADFLKEVQYERGRELAFEGMRKHDLIRWNMYLTNMSSLITEVTNTAPSSWQRASIAAKNSTERNLLPIPTLERTSNPKAWQNKGW